MSALAATGWGLLAASSFTIGGLIGVTVKSSPRTRASMMAFGGGALLYAAVIEALAEAADEDAVYAERWVVVGFSFLGALLFVGLELGLSFVKEKLGLSDDEDEEEGGSVRNRRLTMGLSGRYGGLHAAASTKRPAAISNRSNSVGVELAGSSVSTPTEATLGQTSLRLSDSARDVAGQEELRRGQQASLLFVVASAVDAIPESLVIGMFSNQGDPSSLVSFVLGVFLSQLPTTMSAAEKMLMSGVPPGRIMMMLVAINLWTGFGAMIGSFLSFHSVYEAAIEGLAGGMLLSLVTNTILPEAFAEAGSKGTLVGFYSMLGFLSLLMVALFIDLAE